ncbi:hypothetical protein PHMEG_00039383, partial [Phytophthora megakarya]
MESLKTRSPRLPCHMTPSLWLGLAALVKTIRTLHLRSIRKVLVMQCLPDWKHLPSPRSSVMPRALTTQCANLGCRPRRSSRIGMGLLSLRTQYRCTSTIELSTTLKLLRSTSHRTQTTISRSFTSSGTGARRILRGEAEVMLLSAVLDAHHMVNPRLTTVFRHSTLAWRLLSPFRLLRSLS